MQVEKALGSSILNLVGNPDGKTLFRGRLGSTQRRWAWTAEPLQLEDFTLEGPAAEDCWNNDTDAASSKSINMDALAVEFHRPEAVGFEERIEAFRVIVCVREKVARDSSDPRFG
ncbi:hypothetical protein BDK51DRAFT_29828 [Blyttiomyces helicus]|uniref:Uncharacterized protein n=1 Tax=Blyttiomyces helicus TaxID=388810 RepID=A0A4P9WB84_9FUNG|nr:hypothetical protein BDK51DRAFT_29828 [Blyttiomyces helicus]|eukprot:RKO88803.1 hypothetical protein BDK51DRAFT_29828 [Blyttiomyces helicus]